VAVFFASDMHLRLDRPDRGDRLARWVEGLNTTDVLYLVGDVCDFWFASRQRKFDPRACPGLAALADFSARGGSLSIMPGNHDQSLGPFYQDVLGARFVAEPLDVAAFGLRIHLVHGHRTGGRPPWKAGMESRAFLTFFEHLPSTVADRLDAILGQTNDRRRIRDENKLIPLFRRYQAHVGSAADIVVFGHVHTPLDDVETKPRLVILGGWHTRTSYLRVDDQGARLVVEHDPSPVTI
jgi:UDP-2,3-diacylglucosamine hydrolase